MERFAYMRKLPGRKPAFFSGWFQDAFMRNCHMSADRSMGWRCRPISSKPQEPVYYGA